MNTFEFVTYLLILILNRNPSPKQDDIYGL